MRLNYWDRCGIRCLGNGSTQQQAIEEIRALKENNPLRKQVEYLLYRWRIYVTSQDNMTEYDEELLMNLDKLVEEREQQLLQQGMQKSHDIVENLLTLRFGAIDENIFPQIVERLLKLPPQESSRLILQSSREELIGKLSQENYVV